MTEKRKKLLSALLSLSLAAGSIGLAGCSDDDEQTKEDTKSKRYVIQLNDSCLTVYETTYAYDIIGSADVRGARDTIFYFPDVDGNTCILTMDNCIITDNKEEAESICEEFKNQANIDTVWISSKHEEKTR